MLKIQSDKNSNRNKPGTIEQQKKTWKREGNVARKYDSPKAHTPSIVRNKNPTSLSKFPKNRERKAQNLCPSEKSEFYNYEPDSTSSLGYRFACLRFSFVQRQNVQYF